MNRNIFLIIIFLLSIQLYTATSQERASAEQATHQSDELNRVSLFAQAFKKYHAHVFNWTVYARENEASNVTLTQFHHLFAQKKAQLTRYSWKKLRPNEGAIGWQGTKKVTSGNYQMRVTYIAYPKGKYYQTVVLYRVSGESLMQNEWLKNKKEMTAEMSRIFHGQEHIYTCVKAYRSAKMKLALIDEGKRYLNFFSAAPIERLQEKTFVSISAYTKTWNNAIYTANKKMNIQAALRNDGDRTIIVLGSPIITTEY
ncbi:YwmB family TATA-box binding protein [Sporolactobacillus nakayamae]|uniref:TATA-box binding n=1 Tax=Sporolactobacillus nakayamae TaxID=269670 RepID=A0A1I2Q4P8_9BACL|nr:YwmB family TATA-box binding protein [Sporolactobacillus nakayamae]SFG22643.1 TATA-box binding [Sporolactobacillus nakayamae]